MTLPDAIRRWRPRDPRLYQIATLASLLLYGLTWLDFEITPARAIVLLATVLVTQAVCDQLTAGRLLQPAAVHRDGRRDVDIGELEANFASRL